MASLTTTDRIDDLALQADRTGQHAGLAEQFLLMASRMPAGAASLRAEILVAAAEQLQLCDQPNRAVDAVRQAQADGGPVRLGVLAHLFVALDTDGQTGEADGVLAAIEAGRPTDLALHLLLGEHCARTGRRQAAATWLTRGLVLAERSATVDMHVVLLLIARRWLRDELGFPPDNWDERADAIAARAAELLEDESAVHATPPRGGCPCGSGRKARRCCRDEHGGAVAVVSREGDATVLDLVST